MKEYGVAALRAINAMGHPDPETSGWQNILVANGLEVWSRDARGFRSSRRPVSVVNVRGCWMPLWFTFTIRDRNDRTGKLRLQEAQCH